MERRGEIIAACFGALEALTGEQLVAIVTLDDDENATTWTWALDDELAAVVTAALLEGRWNASKSL